MKRILIALAILILVIGGVFLGWQRVKAAQPVEKTKYKLGTVQVGTVKKTVSATGVIKPWTTVDIKSKAGGRVDEMRVEVGDRVAAGQILAVIDPSDTQLQVDQAQADIQSADARIASSKIGYDLAIRQNTLAVATAETSLKAAEASLAAAKARLRTAELQKTTQPKLTEASIASARANLDSARKQLDELKYATHPQQRAAAESALAQAEANLRNAEANLSRQQNLLQRGFVSQQVVDQALANRDVSAAQVLSAKKKLDTIAQEQEAAEAAAQARVNQANAQYQNALAQQVDVDVRESAYREATAAVAQATQQVESAKRNLELARANLKNNQIRQTEITTAQASKARALASFVNAKKTFDQTVVRAPVDGVVLVKYVEQGTIISSALSFAATGNNILQIGDVTRMYVDCTVDETDIANVNVGQNVDVVVEAYPNATVEGKVTRIDPQAQVEQNVTNIHVRVEIDPDSPAFQLLKPGMNATCEFVSKRADDVLFVPNEAVRTGDSGSYVEVASGGTPAPVDPKSGEKPDPNTRVDVKLEKRPVEVGIEGNETTQIISGLKEGEVIVVTTIEPVKQQAAGAFGSGPIGMRGMGRSR